MRGAALVIAIAALGCAHHRSAPAPATMIDGSPAAARHDVRFSPGEPGAVVGKLTDEDGRPMVGAVVVVSDPQRQGVADDAGEFAIRNLSAGTHDVTLYFNDLAFRFGEVATGTRIDASISTAHARATEYIHARR